MKKYILLYGDKKEEDNILIKNMFDNTKQIKVVWTDNDFRHNMKIVEESINKEKIEQIIFLGLEKGWDRIVNEIKEKNNNIIIKVICNTLDSLLYYDYERENFFKLLELSKTKKIDHIAFLRKGQYETYKSLGYSCSFLMQNFNLSKKKEIEDKDNNDNKKTKIGIYPLNYTWDKNIFNQLCISKYIENSILRYNCLDERMNDFLIKMDIESEEDNIPEINEYEVMKKLKLNDINIACSFTEYLHTIFFLSFEQGVPCLIGNNSDLFEKNSEILEYIISKEEDNNITNARKVETILENKEKIIELYKKWKVEYNPKANNNIKEFLNV